jgi:2-keto-4-pentenoate hydratase
MDNDDTLNTLLAAYRAGSPQPAQLVGKVPMDDAYALQVRLLRRLREAGAAHSGWKIGQTNAAMRAERGEDRLAPGFLLQDVCHQDGATVSLTGPGEWFLEPELAFVLGEELRGPDVDEATVARSVTAMHPAYELVRRPMGWDDRALQRAVNCNQTGYVLGPALAKNLSADEIQALQVEVVCDDRQLASVCCGDVIDHPLTSVAWLANYLGELGERLPPGHVILTGSFTPLLPMQPGQSWRTRMDDAVVSMESA